jgi:hypothetical protein
MDVAEEEAQKTSKSLGVQKVSTSHIPKHHSEMVKNVPDG